MHGPWVVGAACALFAMGCLGNIFFVMADEKLFDEDFLRRLQRLGLIAKRIPTSSAAGGQRRSRRLGDGLEFADHRAYASGDDIRFLDWPYYARMEKLLLRLFHEHSEGVVTLLLDRSASMGVGQARKFNYARRTATALAYVAMSSLDQVLLLPFAQGLDEGLRTGRNAGQIAHVLDFLERLGLGECTSLSKAVGQYVHRVSQTGTVLIISDCLEVEGELSDALAMLRHRRDEVILLHVADRQESDPPLAGPVQLADAETGRTVNLSVNQEVLARYGQLWKEFVRGLERTCLSRGAIYVQAPTDMPFEHLVLQTLQKAGVLQG